ncbi:MAG: YicC/YloC family endoribonuclease, partial [Clostridia bacterium]
TVELKSVNHRFLDIGTKTPRSFIAYEDLIRKVLTDCVSRGHIDVFINYVDNTENDRVVTIDKGLAKSLVTASITLSEELNLKNDYQVNALMRVPDVIKISQNEEDAETLRKLLEIALNRAVEALNVMRAIEGKKLYNDILARVVEIESLTSKIAIFAPQVTQCYKAKLEERIATSLGDIAIDQSKLANEIAFYADKSNIDEEIARLYSHISQVKSMLEEKEPIGRKLDFIVQEFNREANTICSKSNNIDLTNLALKLKNEIEKVREQVQNVE